MLWKNYRHKFCRINSKIPTPNKRLTRRAAAKRKQLEDAESGQGDTVALNKKEEAKIMPAVSVGPASTLSDDLPAPVEQGVDQGPTPEPVNSVPEKIEETQSSVKETGEATPSTLSKVAQWTISLIKSVLKLVLGTVIFVFLLTVTRQHLAPILRRDLPGWMFDFEGDQQYQLPDPVEVINALISILVTVFIMSKF